MTTTPRNPLAPFASYEHASAYDEYRGPNAVRYAWQRSAADFDSLGVEGITMRWREGLQQLRDNGVTYSTIGESGSERPWRLDGIPAIIDDSEWDHIAAGVMQRAQLLEAIIADCYGSRELISGGHLPAGSVYGHPGFLRPCHNVPPPGGHYLHLLAVDLLRGPDGRWLVTNHRCQAPTGLGYALENRIIVARAFANVYHAAGVVRLADFFRELRDHLHSLARHHQDEPRVVMLTPPSPHSTAFENAYLARYLNLPLVRGEDLTVRDEGVFLKTLGGLEPVDVILRRVPDNRCDPLELDNDGADGTPGLLHAARRGQVTVINGFGCSLAENGAWLPYLPQLSRDLLGEELLLPSIPTRWGGDELDEIENDFDHLVIKRAFGVGASSPRYTAALLPDERAALLAQVREHPCDYVAQADVLPSSTPTWSDGKLFARPMVLRAFVTRSGSALRVMPGGLTRVSTTDDHTAFAMQRGGVAKDLWIIGSGPRPVTSLLKRREDLVLKRASTDLPSRVADNLFWFGRYAERAENTARMLRQLASTRDDDSDGFAAVRSMLLALRPAIGKSIDNWPRLLRDPGAEDGLPRLLNDLQRTALNARDRLSNDTWRLANQLIEYIPEEDEDELGALDDIITALAAIAGMSMENSVRGPGWYLMDIGRRIERGDFLCVAIPAALKQSVSAGALVALLELADSIITYRSRYLTDIQLPAVMDLLLTDQTNPRSLRFQVEMIELDTAQLPGIHSDALPGNAERIATRLACDLRLADPIALCADDDVRPTFALLEASSGSLNSLSNELSTRYLSHTAPSRHLGRQRGKPK